MTQRRLLTQRRRSFTAKEKQYAVQLVRGNGKSIHRVARELGLAETPLRRWVLQSETKNHYRLVEPGRLRVDHYDLNQLFTKPEASPLPLRISPLAPSRVL